jgi:hypothetical protein
MRCSEFASDVYGVKLDTCCARRLLELGSNCRYDDCVIAEVPRANSYLLLPLNYALFLKNLQSLTLQ